MPKLRIRHPNTALLVTVAAIGLYLFALVGYAYLGQQRLHETFLLQERLNIDRQATALRYFLDNQRLTLEQLRASTSISRYFANQSLGMSPRYGLHESLLAVGRDLEKAIATKRTQATPIYRRIVFIDETGQVLVSASTTGPPTLAATDSRYDVSAAQRPQFVHRGSEILLQLGTAVSFQGHKRGYLIAEIPTQTVLQPFLTEPLGGDTVERQVSRQRHGAVFGGAGLMLAQTHADGWPRHQQAATRNPVEAPIADNGRRVLALPGDGALPSAATSPVFLAAIALIAVPLLFGAMYLWRLNNRHLILRSLFDTARQQHERLRAQNERLHGEIDRRVASEQALVHQANYDQLTGLPNRTLALDRLEQAIKWAKREDSRVLVFFIDLDRFKQVNDSLGHAAGDDVLREAARRLQSRVRDRDTVSRIGGDEFMIVCTDGGQTDAWRTVAQLLLQALSTPFQLGDHELFVGGSIGISVYPEGGEESHELLKNADIAMYAAKAHGRNAYKLYDPSMDAFAMETTRLERYLRHALDREELQLLYQPIVDLSSGRTVAIEALLRWHNDELGDVPACRFVPIAEETGLIHEIGEWVLREACRTLSQLQTDGQMRVAVNLSSTQFSHPGRLLDSVLDALRSSGLMPEQLEIEINESILIDDRHETHELINQLDRIGVRLSLDDFGTGYSALNYLHHFPFDVLKIDRSFTTQVPDSEANAALIRAIIAMAHALDLEVVAEGIEGRPQAGFLLIHHCEFGQGYLYSEPLPAAHLAHHLNRTAALAV